MGQLKLENACKSFGTVDVIRDVNLDVQDGEFCVFVGPSGCGKSTLFAHDRGAGGYQLGRHSDRWAGGELPCRPRSAKSRWCFNPTRFTRI